MPVIVALTAQNTVEVTDVHEVPPEHVRAQLEAVLDDIGAAAAKTGMPFSGCTPCAPPTTGWPRASRRRLKIPCGAYNYERIHSSIDHMTPIEFHG
jgi:hypothetical protein